MTPLQEIVSLLPVCPYCVEDCAVGYGHCHCGCGEKTQPSPQSHTKTGIKKGDPMKYVKWHTFAETRKFNEGVYTCVCRDNSCQIPYGLCHCGCEGETMIATGTRLSRGDFKGYPRKFLAHHHKRRHGQTVNSLSSRTYQTWSHMRQRCDNPNQECYKHYGGRGITISERWRSFKNFLADMGERPDGMSLDRIDVNGNYEPGNCRWATQEMQHNNKRSNVYIEYGGEKLSIAQLTRLTGMSKRTINYRIIHMGMSVEEAMLLGSERGNARHGTVDSFL